MVQAFGPVTFGAAALSLAVSAAGVWVTKESSSREMQAVVGISRRTPSISAEGMGCRRRSSGRMSSSIWLPGVISSGSGRWIRCRNIERSMLRESTRNVFRAASVAGVKLFLSMSSVKAMGEGSEIVLDEGDDSRPSTPYGISKLESEDAVRAEAVGTGSTVMILRLPTVYGPGNKGNLPRMIRWAENGYPFPIFHPENLRSMVYVGNVVAGMMALLKASPAAGTTYILKDREDYSTTMVYGAICNALGKRPRYLPLPSLAVRMGRSLSEDFRKITGSFRVSSAKFEKDLKLLPPSPWRRG